MSDRFVSKRPTFQATTNQNSAEATTPRPKDTTPSASVVERLEAEGHTQLAAMLAHAQAVAKENAVIIGGRVATTTRIPREERFSSKWEEDQPIKESAPPTKQTSKFQPSDVVDDATFIRKTRDSNVHTPEMQALFWANGGERHLIGGLQYAQAFDNLRREKMRILQGKTQPLTAPYQRHGSALPQGAKVITPGVPTQRDRERHLKAQLRQTRIVANEKWAFSKK